MSAPPATKSSATLRCPECAGTLPISTGASGEFSAICPRCRESTWGWTFPAFTQEHLLNESPAPALEGEAACFFHEKNRANRTCDGCGRFLCRLCEMRIGGHFLCPTCIGASSQSGERPELIMRRVAWTKMALLLGWLPLLPPLWLFFPAYLLTAPTALFAALYGWSRPGSITGRRSRSGATLGALGGLIQIVVLVAIVILTVKRFRE